VVLTGRAHVRVLWVIVLLPVVAHAAGVELEVAPGYAWSRDIATSAPVLRGRFGIEYPWFTPSIVAIGTFLGNPGPLVHQGQRGGWTGWGVAADVRFHTSGEHRFVAGLGAGWGQLSTLQVENGDLEGYRGTAAPYVEGAMGYQWVRGDLRLGVELTVDVFNRINLVGDIGSRFCVEGGPTVADIGPCPTGRSFAMLGLALTLGFAPQ
jgi:hypothetical protein